MKDELIGKTLPFRCIDLSFEGKGVAKNANLTVFVASMYPGDEGDVLIDYKRNGLYFGHLKRLSVFSKDRVVPLCKTHSACGGCAYQAYAYEAEKEAKRKLVAEQLRKIARIDVDVRPTLGMDAPIHYRNKIQMPFGYDKKGRAVCGFYRQDSHDIVPISECMIEDERGIRIIASIRAAVADLGIKPYDEKKKEGFLRHVLIRTSSMNEDALVVLVGRERNAPNLDALVRRLIKECPFVAGVLLNVNEKDTNVVLSERKEIVLFGKPYIEEKIDGIVFRVSAKSFFQTNPQMTAVLYETAMDFADIGPEDVVIDAYSGVGTIGLIAAKRGAKKVTAVECVEEAVRDAKENAKRNGVNNFETIAMDATEYLEKLAFNRAKIDIVFLDPPRKGASRRFIDAVMGLEPRKVVYVSCNPSTLARDLAVLKEKYEIETVQPVDMFPRTKHVETIALLTRK